MKTPENAVKIFEKVINDNYFTMEQELRMLQVLVNKYNPMSITDLAKLRGISQPAISKKLKNGKLMYLQFGSVKLIICEY